jgi:hypothetical protein
MDEVFWGTLVVVLVAGITLLPVLAHAIKVPAPTIPEEYNIGVLRAEDTAIRESDLDEFKKMMDEK